MITVSDLKGKEDKNKFARDLFARYVDETMRKTHPGHYWSFETKKAA